MNDKKTYQIGTAGEKWGEAEKLQWLERQAIKRSYRKEVVVRLEGLKDKFVVEQYGALSYAPDRYPLFLVKTATWDQSRPVILITGGVHGYETSGVHGALQFVDSKADKYLYKCVYSPRTRQIFKYIQISIMQKFAKFSKFKE